MLEIDALLIYKYSTDARKRLKKFMRLPSANPETHIYLIVFVVSLSALCAAAPHICESTHMTEIVFVEKLTMKVASLCKILLGIRSYTRHAFTRRKMITISQRILHQRPSVLYRGAFFDPLCICLLNSIYFVHMVGIWCETYVIWFALFNKVQYGLRPVKKFHQMAYLPYTPRSHIPGINNMRAMPWAENLCNTETTPCLPRLLKS